MKNILITIAVVLLVGCGESKESAPLAEAEPVAAAAKLEPANAKAPSISISKAVDSGNLEAVKQHIAAGANLNKKDVGGFSLLHWAADYGHKEIAELLIANGADVNAGRPFLDSSRPFLDSNNEIKIYYGETPLDMALSEENKETADLLRKHGAKTRDWLNADKSIHIAAGSGHVEAVKKHLAAGVDLNAKDNTGWTPLDHAKDHPETAGFLRKQGGKSGGEDSIHVAAWVGNIDAFKKHLADGVDLNAEDDNGWTLFSCAVNGGHKGIVELLIAEGVDVNIKNSGCENLYYAVAEGHKEIIGLLIAAGVDVNCKDDDGMTPLHSAAQFASKEIVELLITKGADVNAKDDSGETSLHSAAGFGRNESAKLLIDNGADVNAKSDDGSTPLDYAEHETIALLRKHGGKTGEELKGGETVAEAAQPEPTTNEAQALDFWFVVISGHAGDVKQAIAEGADVNAKVGGGKTPLHGAASNGFKEIAELLIANGADVNAKDDYGGKTPLYDAIKDHKEIVELLLAKGADLNVKPEIGYPLLHEATRWGRTEVVELLIANGANVNEKTRGAGVTPLDTAVFNKKEVTALLRKHGGKTKKELEAAELGVSVEHLPRISIHDASGARGRKGNIEAVKQHLAAGTDVDARDAEDKTPLQHAAYWGHKEIAELLIAKGADINAKDRAGRTSLNWGRRGFKQTEIIALLRKHGGKTSEELKAGDNELAAKPKVTSFKSMPEIDLASFTEEQQATILARANKEGCDCGCKMTVAECRNDDTSCRTSVRLAKVIVDEVTGGKPNSESKADGGQTGEELKTAGKPTTTKAPDTSLWEAAMFGKIEAAKKAIADGADVNAKDEDTGNTPLHSAVAAALDSGRNEVAELLIANGADVNAKDGKGWTPLDITKRLSEAATLTKRLRELQGKTDDISVADLLRKHGGKTAEELKAEGN